MLRSDIFHWRSRCHRRQRDFEAAREDVERALELAQGLGDRAMMANAYFQASLVAERTGHWLLSRNYAEQAKTLFQELEDERNVGRLLINLGGLNLLLGKPQEAIEHLKASFAVAVEVDSQGDAAPGDGRARHGAPAPRRVGRGRRARAARAASCSTGAKTSWTRSASRSSCSVARCSSAGGSTRPRSASARPTRASSSSPRSATAPVHGSRSAISPRGAATTARRRALTGTPPKRCRTSGSKTAERRRHMKTRLMSLLLTASRSRCLVGRPVLGAGAPGLTAASSKAMARLAACVAPRRSLSPLCTLAAGCGGSSSDAKEEPAARFARGALARSRRADVAIVPGHGGLRAGARPALVPRRRRRRGGSSRAHRRASGSPAARRHRRSPRRPRAPRRSASEGSEQARRGRVFVAHLELAKPGKYWVLAEPVGGRKIQAIGNVVVRREAGRARGRRAGAGVGHADAREHRRRLAALTTQKPPDRELSCATRSRNRSRDKVPFVRRVRDAEVLHEHAPAGRWSTSSTPSGASSTRHGVRFIHVEIYEGNDPAKG